MTSRILKISLLLIALLVSLPAFSQHSRARMLGKVVSTEDNKAVPYASVYLKNTTYGATAKADGTYVLHAPAGDYTVVVAALGFKTEEHKIKLKNGPDNRYTLVVKQQKVDIEKVTVLTSGITLIKESAYNVAAIDATELHNTTLDIAHALERIPGVKLRESGGFGSDMRFSLDGFSGKHIKFFIDGVPMEGVGKSFGINNIPINYAERLEVYKGVIPVEFGADALGGAVNIVTKKNVNTSYLDASYSFGSYNTHKSYVNVGHVTKKGIMFDINAFQNYSDNNYKTYTYSTEFLPGGVEQTDMNDLRDYKRFHDTYHNEAVIAKAGVVGKKYADRLLAGINLSQYSKEIQNGVKQEIVFGDKYTEGYTITPSIEYSKRNLFTEGLHVSFTANYNINQTHNVDTSGLKYNWKGESKVDKNAGEINFQDSKFKSDNWNTTFNARYFVNEHHSIVLNNVLSGFNRKTRSTASTTTSTTSFDAFEKVSRKSITGLSYTYNRKKWNISVFGKHHNQYVEGPVQTSSGSLTYKASSVNVDEFGYGMAVTRFFGPFQAKLSYEKAHRLPTVDELFGDEDMELGGTGLKPEKSYNYNFNLSYGQDLGKHSVFVEGGFIYRDTRDFIKRKLDTYSGNRSYGSHENYGKVRTVGFNVDARYSYSNWFSAGGNLTVQHVRDYEKMSRNSNKTNQFYKQRIPNMPYIFTNADASFYVNDLLKKNNTLTITYDNLYIHEFPLNTASQGSKASKRWVEEQFVHNLRLTYSMDNGKYNLSLECHNLLDDNTYDNYGLQKVRRAFYGKIRILLRK